MVRKERDHRDEIANRSDLAINLANFISRNPGKSVSEIADALEADIKSISNILKPFRDSGMVRVEKDGRKRRYYPKSKLEKYRDAVNKIEQKEREVRDYVYG